MEQSASNCYWSKVQLGLQNTSDATLLGSSLFNIKYFTVALVVGICAIWSAIKLGGTINCCNDNAVHVQNDSSSLTSILANGESVEDLPKQIQKLRADLERRSEYQKELEMRHRDLIKIRNKMQADSYGIEYASNKNLPS